MEPSPRKLISNPSIPADAMDKGVPMRNDAKNAPGRWARLVPFGTFTGAVIFLSFVAGSVATITHMKPTDYICDAYRAAAALYAKFTRYDNPLDTDLWAPARSSQRGTTVYDSSRVYPGLTLYTSGHATKAFLIDMQGRVVHQWHRDFSTVWDPSAAVRHPVPDDRINFRKARLFPNGDLLAIYTGVGDTPYGYGMIKLDRDSNLIWKNLDHFHHDFDFGPDGRIYGLSQDFRAKPPPGLGHLHLPVLEDFLVVLSPEGDTLKKISLLDAVNKSAFRRYLWLVTPYGLGDPLHTNNVDVLDAAAAARLEHKIPEAAAGQVLLSFRELAGGTIALLDVAKAKIVWAMRGSWLSQHDPDTLPDGNLLLFDNRGHIGPGGASRIVEVDPGDGRMVWQYAGNGGHIFQSMIRSDQQRQPNGNTLITESDGGRLLEITDSGKIVWEFINPVRGGKHNERIPVVNWAQRIDPRTLRADFRSAISTAISSKEGN
jgi:Arylsulfotransferase (ASST)